MSDQVGPLPRAFGHDCEIVGPTSVELKEECTCSVCLLIYRSPHLMGCCGQHICEGCLKPIKVGAKKCPLCNQEFVSLLDRGFERRVLSLVVTCTNKEAGCDWRGELRGLDRHLDPSTGDCRFVPLQCQWKCGELIQRHCLEHHQLSLCPKRPWYTCFDDPNLRTLACKVETLSIEKQMLAQEVSDLKAVVEQTARDKETLQSEMDQQRVGLQEMAAKIDTLSAQLESLKPESSSNSDIIETSLSVIDNTNMNSEATTSTNESNDVLCSPIADPPPEPLAATGADPLTSPVSFTVNEFNRRKKQSVEWYSPPFYSHAQGYRLQLRVDCGGVLEGKGSHVSVYLYLTKGDQDKNLRWPFLGLVTVQLLDQHGDAHLERVIEFTKGLGSDVAGCVKESGRAKRGHGYCQFIPLIDLTSSDQMYLKNNCLKFKVTVDPSVAKTSIPGLFSGLFTKRS